MSERKTFDSKLETIPDEDLDKLANTMIKMGLDYPHRQHFLEWLADAVITPELAARHEARETGDDAPREPTLVSVPTDWTNRQCADAAETMLAFGFAGTGEKGISEALGRFIDFLQIHVVSVAVNRLRALPEPHTVN